MRIGVDARELTGHATGVGRFLRGLLREWSKTANYSPGGAHEFVLYAPEPLDLGLDSRRFRTREAPGAPGVWWEQVLLPQAAADDRLDVFFAPAYTAPLRLKAPLVAAIYDVSFTVHPEWFRMREGMRRRWLTQKTADKAQAVITLSNFSRSEIISHLGAPERKVHAIVPGIDHPAEKVPGAFTYEEARVLYVGSIFNRRHVPDLVRAIAALRRIRPDISLDIVGDNRTFPHEDLEGTIANLGLNGHVRWRRYVSNDQLLELYRRARAFAFLSEYEGLGMTPLEALGAGTPPVVYDTAVAREACGAAALYVPVGDREGVVRALERALFDEPTRASILAAAPAILAKYDWARAAGETLAVIESVAN
jgi:glycosyltransferase involved in cell wall biosynthesis